MTERDRAAVDVTFPGGKLGSWQTDNACDANASFASIRSRLSTDQPAGTMNALFLKYLADQTRRGLRGRIEDGKSGGGLCFGYDVVRAFSAAGDPVRGDR